MPRVCGILLVRVMPTRPVVLAYPRVTCACTLLAPPQVCMWQQHMFLLLSPTVPPEHLHLEYLLSASVVSEQGPAVVETGRPGVCMTLMQGGILGAVVGAGVGEGLHLRPGVLRGRKRGLAEGGGLELTLDCLSRSLSSAQGPAFVSTSQ